MQPTGAPKLQRRTPIFMDEQAKEWRGGGGGNLMRVQMQMGDERAL